MTDTETVLSELHRLHAQLREGHRPAYLEIHRIMLAHGLHADAIGTTDAALRELWRESIIAEARVAHAELRRGDRNQYLEVIKTLAVIGETPQSIGTTAEDLRALWRKAAFAAARDCRERLSESLHGDVEYIELLDHLAILGADPETLGLTLQDMRAAVR